MAHQPGHGHDPRRAHRRVSGRPTTPRRAPLLRLDNPLQVAFAVLAFAMVGCMIASTCLAPF